MEKDNKNCIEQKDILRMLRLINDLYLADVAKGVGVSPSHLTRIEKGEKNASQPLLEKMCDIYNVTTDKVVEFMQVSQQQGFNRYETLRMILEYYVLENPKTSEDISKCLEKNRK